YVTVRGSTEAVLFSAPYRSLATALMSMVTFFLSHVAKPAFTYGRGDRLSEGSIIQLTTETRQKCPAPFPHFDMWPRQCNYSTYSHSSDRNAHTFFVVPPHVGSKLE